MRRNIPKFGDGRHSSGATDINGHRAPSLGQMSNGLERFLEAINAVKRCGDWNKWRIFISQRINGIVYGPVSELIKFYYSKA